jgi:hypothetical protein
MSSSVLNKKTPSRGKEQSHDIMKNIFSQIILTIWGFLLLFLISTLRKNINTNSANTTEKFPGSSAMTCNILWSHPTAGSLGGSTFILYSLILGFAIPLSLILVFYYLVIKKLQTVGPKVRRISISFCRLQKFSYRIFPFPHDRRINRRTRNDRIGKSPDSY